MPESPGNPTRPLSVAGPPFPTPPLRPTPLDGPSFTEHTFCYLVGDTAYLSQLGDIEHRLGLFLFPLVTVLQS